VGIVKANFVDERRNVSGNALESRCIHDLLSSLYFRTKAAFEVTDVADFDVGASIFFI
jgi:hypothetical protein